MKKLVAFGTMALLSLLLTACASMPQFDRTASTATAAETPAAPTIESSVPPDAEASDEAEIIALVQAFGSRLQAVSLQSPDFTEEMRAQYADFVDPSLLEEWSRDPSITPGRAVSSPWPDRIEIESVEPVSPGAYTVAGYVIEITSSELTHGGEAARSPVRITVRKLQGHWLITGYELQTTPPTLVPADSDSPASGICAPIEGETATFEVSLDVPSPRCAQVHPSQRLEIVNPTDTDVVVTFAGRDLPIEARGSIRIDEPFSSYLAPGVHFVYVTQGTGNLPELWLLPD